VLVNLTELLEQLNALCSRALELAVRIRRDTDSLMEVQHELSAAVNVLAPMCAIAERPLATRSSSAMSTSETPPMSLLRIDHVVNRLGLSRSQVWRMVKEERFPKPRRLSTRAVAWLEPDVTAWIRNRPVFDLPDVPKQRARRRLERA
jgi:prophage regulatory protein